MGADILAAPAEVTVINRAGNILTVNFDRPVKIYGIPQLMNTAADEFPISCVENGPLAVDLEYDTAPIAGDVRWPICDPALKTETGGFTFLRNIAVA